MTPRLEGPIGPTPLLRSVETCVPNPRSNATSASGLFTLKERENTDCFAEFEVTLVGESLAEYPSQH